MVKPLGRSTTNCCSFLLTTVPLHLLLVSVQKTKVLLMGLHALVGFLVLLKIMIAQSRGNHD